MAAPQSQIAVQQTQDKLRQQDLTKDLDLTSGDIKNGKKLSDFAIGKQMRPGVGRAILNALIVRLSFGGMGVDLRTLLSKPRGQ